LLGGDLRGVLRRPFLGRARLPSSAIYKAVFVGFAEASSAHSGRRGCLLPWHSVKFSLLFQQLLEIPVGFWTALGWAGTWKFLGSCHSSVDSRDLVSHPLTLRTLLHSPRKNNTRGVNSRCIFHELEHGSNRLTSKYLREVFPSLLVRVLQAARLLTLPIPFRTLQLFAIVQRIKKIWRILPFPTIPAGCASVPFPSTRAPGNSTSAEKKSKCNCFRCNCWGHCWKNPARWSVVKN
jgi:hypothetical protein